MPENVIKIFYSYSRKDLEMRNTLEDHLSALRRANRIQTWHDLQLEAGTEWEPAILKKLDTADIILLLVSRNFIASEYCYGTELKRAIARHHEGSARVIPIILRPCDWNHSDVPFSKLNVLPTHAKAITSWSDSEEAFTIVAQRIRETVDQLRDKKQAEHQAEDQQNQQRLAQKEAEENAERMQREQRQAAEQFKEQQHYKEDLGNNIFLDMVAIPEGIFQMGATEYDDEQPIHLVKVAAFFMGQYPITQAQWFVVAGFPKVKIDLNPNPSHFKGGDSPSERLGQRPVENVSWWEAVEFCQRLSRQTNRPYRLPSEAEWEYACRAGTTTPYHFGEFITAEWVNYDATKTFNSSPKGQYRAQTTPVGSFGVANAFGLYDMHGNVWEWCADHWHENYQGAPVDGSAWLTADQAARRLMRGGSWSDAPRVCRSAFRACSAPGTRGGTLGFRVVCGLA